MKKNRNRLISLLLALALVLSLCTGALAAELEADASAFDIPPAAAETSEEVPAQGAASNEEDECAAEDGQEDNFTDGAEAEPSEAAGDESAPADASVVDAEDNAPSEDTEELAAQEATAFNITETIPLTLEYDDHFSFSEVKEGYVVAQIQKKEVTSFKVSEGKVTETRDNAVIALNSGSDTEAVATGTGTATVLMVKKADLEAAKKVLDGSSTASVNAVQVDVEVSPAPLTIMFLGGQSNMEGWGSDPGRGGSNTFQHPEQSIACPEGVVYSTYAPGKTAIKKRANSIGGNVNFKGTYCKTSNAKNFIPKCLTGSNSGWSLGGTKLIYPVNQLTTAGSGKTGPDSGLAYEWNRLTGDKVWTINAAQGSSAINMWTPGKECYKRAYAIYGYALKVYKAEIKAGHYTQSHQLFFWLQGEHDYELSGSKYFNDFKLMHNNLKRQLGNIYGEGFEQMGIITVRATGPNKSKSTYRGAKDIYMTGPRITQSYLANTRKLEDVHIVSDVNEQWVSDSGVAKYFQRAYGSKLDYKTQSGSLSLPTAVSQVHNDIHYTQVAHNENGLTAARGMYEVCTNTNLTAVSVRWRNYYGKQMSGLNLIKGESAYLIPGVSPVSASKTLKWQFSSGLSYSGTSGKVTVTGAGRQEACAMTEDGTVVSTFVVSRGDRLPTPTLKSVNNASGKKIKAAWGAVSGAEGYQIQCSLSSDFSSSVKTLSASGTSATLTGLKAKKTYYVRVRAWKSGEDGKIASAWSSKKSVKIKK